MTRPSAISLRDVTIHYGQRPAVRDVSCELPRGALIAIAGPNGAGKSTLLNALMGEHRLARGVIDRHGVSTRAFAYLPQTSVIDRRFPLTVADTITLGAWPSIGAFTGLDRTGARRIATALAAVGLSGFQRRAIAALSVGQFQRVLFARLMAQSASVILLDEPFAAVDARTTDTLLDVIHGWQAEGRTVIAVLHDFEQIRRHFTHTVLLARELVACGPTETVLTETHKARARALVEHDDDLALSPDGTPETVP